jgi:hypothetical protein
VYAGFDFARYAGCFALELTKMIKDGEDNWKSRGLYYEEPSPIDGKKVRIALNVRIGLHSGPVFMHYNPVLRQLGFTGAHVSRAARIEPVTRAGEVYASEEFAAMAELGSEIERRVDGNHSPEGPGFVCEFAGSMKLAKGLPGQYRIYRVISKRSLDNLFFSFHNLGENARSGGACHVLPHQNLRAFLLCTPARTVVPENLHRLIELPNLQWLLQNSDWTNPKNPIENLAIWVTRDHDNVEVRINLLGCFKHLITRSVRQLQVQEHEVKFLFPEAFNGLFSRADHHSTKADLLQECSKELLQARIVVHH